MKKLIESNEDRDAFIREIAEIDCKLQKFSATFTVYRKPRSNQQNRLFHALLNCLHQDTENGRGFTLDELKEHFIGKFSPWYTKEINGKEESFRKRSSSLTTAEMTILIDGVYRDAIQDFNCVCLPRPGDDLYDKFYQQYAE